MSYAGLDLSRQRLDVHVLDEEGRTVEVTAVRPDADALGTLATQIFRHGGEVTATIESMTGARFVHDQLELRGWDVAIGDAVKVKGLAPLAAKTDKIDARVLAELARRDLVPEIWLPTPGVRAERARARFRLHLVRHRTALKNRIHSTLMSFGHPVPVADLFGVAGRELLASMDVPEPWNSTHGPLPTRQPVRWQGSPRAAREERPRVPALGAHRGRRPRGPTPLLQGALRADEAPARSPAWRQGRSRRPGQAVGRRDLACVDEEQALRSGRPRDLAGRLTTHLWNRAAGSLLPDLVLPSEKAIEVEVYSDRPTTPRPMT